MTSSARRPAPLWGVHFPQFRTGIDAVAELAIRAETAGFDSFWLMDHLVTPGAPGRDTFEGWTLLTALATATSRIRLGLLVGCNPFRHPALLAKMAATVDHISAGRLDLGLGWGSYEPELAAFGFAGTSRTARAEALDESLDIIKLMFAGKAFDYLGRHFRLRDAIGLPTPVQPTVPVHIGGAGRTLTMPLVAKHADWWNCVAPARDQLEALLPLRGSARVSVQYLVGLAESPADRAGVSAAIARRGLEQSWGPAIAGTPDELAEAFRAERARGVEMFVLHFHDYRSPTMFERFMADVASQVD
ncbi:MAG TPA: LLM class flavin-dependent oxidoreductase [Amycolatopsis sp.]|nr:LLM class flavin-dependent oxidoreductase [Amycolatopsis sp.]